MTRRGWCPTLYEPMAAQDGLLVRVKPPLGLLSAEAAMVLAAAATRFGNGVMQLTNRGNLQFRGMSPESVFSFADIVVGLGLAEADVGAERRRNVLVSPLHGLDPAVHPATDRLAKALAAMLTRDRGFEALPAKFGIVVDGGGIWSMGEVPGDVFVALRGDAVLVSVDRVTAAVLAPGDAVMAVRELIAAFLRLGDARRMGVGQAAMLFEAAGLEGPTCALGVAAGPAVSKTVGVVLPDCFGMTAAFGQMEASDLHSLARFARQYGDGSLRVTPWRGFVLGCVSALPEFADNPTLITARGDGRLSIVACVGSPGCAEASVRTLEDARVLARSVAPGQVLHVSGCSKGCAHPGVAGLTLVGEAGLYNLIRGGRANTVPERRGLDLAEVAKILEAEKA